MMRSDDRSSAARAAAVALATVVLGACATKSDMRDLHTELASLAARQDSLITQLRRETLSTQDTLRTQSDQLFDFRGDIARQLQSIAQSLTRLEALTGENQRAMASVRDQLVRGGTGTTTRLPVLADSTATGGARGAETVAGVGGNAEQLWGVAREQHQRGSLSTAQQAYQQFLREYPNNERAADAHFYLGDILAQQERPQDAIREFLEVQRLAPTSPRVPDALYRAARLQADLGNTADARATAERIIATYPEHTMAIFARDLLDELR